MYILNMSSVNLATIHLKKCIKKILIERIFNARSKYTTHEFSRQTVQEILIKNAVANASCKIVVFVGAKLSSVNKKNTVQMLVILSLTRKKILWAKR